MRGQAGKTKLNAIAVLAIIAAVIGALLGWAGATGFIAQQEHDRISQEGETGFQADDLSDGHDTEEPKQDQAVIANRVKELVEGMTLEEKIYQMCIVTPESLTGTEGVYRAGDLTKSSIKNRPVGGIVYFAQNIKTPQQVKDMIEGSQSASKIKMFIGVDEEGGRVARIGSNPAMGTTKLPAMAKIGDAGSIEEAYKIGKTIGSEIKELGFNLDFAPVADVLVNKENNEIGDRSFSSDPQVAAKMVPEVVQGLHDSGVCAVIKHFPGHGSTVTDSHKGYSESVRTLEQLRANEFIPFKAGIAAGTDFVLVSHMSAVKIDDSGMPASLSEKIITDLLKKELGFNKLVVTDSLSMGAVTTKYMADKAAIAAIKAGVDILLMPANLTSAVNGVKAAVQSGEISEQRIDESVEKILQVKLDRKIIS